MENSAAGEITLNQYDSRIEKVKEYLDKNDIEGAKEFLTQFLKDEPNNNHAAFIMAQICEMEGAFSDAAMYYEKVFSEVIPPEFIDRVSHVYEMADRYDKLYQIQKVQYLDNPDDMDICERFANTCCILNKTDEAVELYNKILSVQSENPIALRQLSDMYEHSNKMMFHLTQARLAQLDENFEKAEKEYKKAFTLAENEEDILQIRYKMAKLYRNLNKNEQALDEYIYILSATEENFSIFLELAEIYLELNNLAAAINVLKRAIHVYPDNEQALQLLADTYFEAEDFEKAENYFERLLEVNSENIENKVNLAKVYLQLDKQDKTKEILIDAEKQDANNTEVLTALAGFYTYTNEFEKAKNYCSRIIQKLPKSPLGYKKQAQLYSAMGEEYLAHWNFGLYHEYKNETDEAISEYMEVLKFKKDDFEAMKKLAQLHESLGEFDAAVEYYHTLFEAQVEFSETTQKIANLYMKLQEFDIAQKYIEEALNKIQEPELLFLSGKCLFNLKDYEGAIEALQEYKDNSKSLENIEETEKLIAKIEDKKSGSSNLFVKLFKFFN